MSRRHQEEDHENHERWLVSYADFITLLFAFFVVMYALSTVNEGKYRILSDSLMSAFKSVPGDTAGAQIAIVPGAALKVPVNKPEPVIDEGKRKAKVKMRNMAREIMEALGPLVKEGQVRVTEGAQGITVEINASVLFASGDARLELGALQGLSAVAKILAPTDFPITVEGHTDTNPIATPQFPSNWELSGARASSVVRLFIDNGVSPQRLTSTGYADQRPVADNISPTGRARNRRVAINIESKTPDVAAGVPILPEIETVQKSGK